MENKKKLTLVPLVLMVFTSVFGFNNISKAFYKMGYAAIPWYILSGLTFFILYAFMMAEYGTAFRKEKGGIYSWMEKSVGGKFAFIGTFMWYSSYVIWMVSVATEIWIPLSNLVFGRDITDELSFLGLTSTQILGILAILFVILVTFIASKGLKSVSKVTSVGGTAIALLNVVLLIGAILVFALHGGKLAEPITSVRTFIDSPNPNSNSLINILSFLVFAIFAYGGIEAVGGLVDETEKPEKTFPKGMIISATIIAVGYSLGIFMCGMFLNWNDLSATKGINLANITYIIMNNLGYTIGTSLGLGQATAVSMGAFFARVVGLSMFLAYTGSYFTLIYSPIKQIIEGTPKKLWPEAISKIDDDGIPRNAMWMQCGLVCAFVMLTAFGGDGVSQFFSYIVLMTNVAMTLPYLFIAIAFIGFKKKTEIEKPFVIFKSYRSGVIAAVIVTITVFFANLFTIIDPILQDKPDFKSTLWMIVGPIFFSLVAFIMYSRYEKKIK
ncbi:glutamate/gamma-aminobutyrate family transporter YjeM [Clostridium paridis]|uniref:Glutamate/gamma-aminobutyrate family transporter YjeM n=1 Tax=Clostridium paridis TaxID=2803863 RepID=A0A937FDM9_9CLOT|nr:glutamate/gamma-aminobutyrate family transporter YjeM [Clostridium paridis]MBL4930377.1 glutamate/gamma-aminobutyrate family transporter YjeM [Clostridium paridis]